MDNIKNVSIKIQTGVYSQFRNLNNRVWYAIGEYVDNAVQSFEDNKIMLKKKHNGNYQFNVKINVDLQNNFIKIYDNAAGIDYDNFLRAFEPANIKIDNTGLHEFGMGMKTASIWLADFWSVRTSSLNESIERFVEFDLKKVIEEKKEVLKVESIKQDTNIHFTEITLQNLSNNAPSVMQFDKLKRHLVSIYRKFIRSGDLKLYFNDEELKYETPEILNAPYYQKPNGESYYWKKEIDYSMGKYKVKGFIALLDKMSTNKLNGLSLFRRGRVIEGSHNEKYRPKSICGQVGSPRYKRIFGELELEGFAVSFNKGSFQEQDDLEALMEALRIEISAKDFNLYMQAEKFIKPKSKSDNKKVAKKIIKKVKEESEKDNLAEKITNTISQINNDIENTTDKEDAKINIDIIDSHEDIITLHDNEYKLKVELITESDFSDLYSLELKEEGLFYKTITYKINLAHPFFSRYEQFKQDKDYQPIISIIRSLVLAEVTAPDYGTIHPGNVRLNFNRFLRNL